MSAINFQDLQKSMQPVFDSLVHCLFDGDYKTFLEHHPPAPELSFLEAVAILKPLGKPIDIKYLCHIIKPDRIKMLCKVTYSDASEELLWDFNLAPDGEGYQLLNMGFDK